MSFVLFFVLFYISWIPSTLRIISLFLVVLCHLLYNINEKTHQKSLYWIYFTFISLSLIAYVAAIAREPAIAVTSLIIAFCLFIGWVITSYIISLWKSRNIYFTIFCYLSLSFLIIFSFALIFNFANTFPNHELRFVNNTKVTNVSDIMYFSATNFYSNAVGTIITTGNSRWIMILELAVSLIIKVIILGALVSNLKERKKVNT